MPGLLGFHNLVPLTKTISGIPQQVLALDAKVAGRGLPELVDKVIIGPTSAPAAVHGVVYNAMMEQAIPAG
jgi:hypothetical protein